MIDIYTEKKESSNWILKNDLYFNLNTSNEEMTEQDKNLIFQADDAILTPDKHPEKVVCVEECGPNVLKMIFQLDHIKIYMSRPSFVEIPDNAEICFNEKDVVTGNAGYQTWWTREYERREKNDL